MKTETDIKKETSMKKYYFIFALMFSIVAFPFVAGATVPTQYAVHVTANEDVDTTAEAISTVLDVDLCAWVEIRNAPGPLTTNTNDLLYIGLVSSPLDTTAAANLPNWGRTLYPDPASGDTSWRVTPLVNSRGVFRGINPDYIYAAGSGTDSRVELECMPCVEIFNDGVRCTN
jgi:hypothetical protein